MGKWLVAAGIAIIVMLVFMWRQLDDSSATAAPTPAKAEVAAAPLPTTTAPAAKPEAAKPVAAEAVVAAAEPEPKQKMDVQSDEFFYKFQEVVPAVLSRNAVKCYEGVSKRVHRNQNVVFKFHVKIKDGVVTVSDTAVERSTLGDSNSALETCFLQEIARSTWTDEALPDWEADDQLTISPERGLKKYTRENIEYVGQPAPRD